MTVHRLFRTPGPAGDNGEQQRIQRLAAKARSEREYITTARGASWPPASLSWRDMDNACK